MVLLSASSKAILFNVVNCLKPKVFSNWGMFVLMRLFPSLRSIPDVCLHLLIKSDLGSQSAKGP